MVLTPPITLVIKEWNPAAKYVSEQTTTAANAPLTKCSRFLHVCQLRPSAVPALCSHWMFYKEELLELQIFIMVDVFIKARSIYLRSKSFLH